MSGITLHAITLSIIAGGQGTRMGGPKHRLHLGVTPILEDLLDRLAWPGPTILSIAADRPHIAGQQRCDKVVADTVAGQGPLRGICAALVACETEAMIAVPIDMPRLCLDHLRWLASSAPEHPQAVCIVTRPHAQPDRIEPFPTFLRRTGIPSIESMLQCGDRALHRMAVRPGAAIVEAPAAWTDDVWINLNSPADLDAYARASATPVASR